QAWPMTIGPEPMSRIFFRSVRFGIGWHVFQKARISFPCYILLGYDRSPRGVRMPRRHDGPCTSFPSSCGGVLMRPDPNSFSPGANVGPYDAPTHWDVDAAFGRLMDAIAKGVNAFLATVQVQGAMFSTFDQATQTTSQITPGGASFEGTKGMIPAGS